MTDKELKRLGRAELIEIIFEQQKRCEEYTAIIDKLKKEQEKKDLCISESGSIAEAAIRLNGVFEAAQAAADQYLSSVRAASQSAEAKLAEAENQCAEMLKSARLQADKIIADAEKKAQPEKDH